ncbi:MAG: protein-L-isoaspartate(D-aspartate) O-methyltransferase [Endomicrobiales bacterium]|nr:protein-L-isoaspartate(D-aspartate) O-methyltransferase [Endomicrobiales bacterium]
MAKTAERMIEEQLKPRGIRDERVLAAMGKIPRELFVPLKFRDASYADHPLPIGSDQTISQPYMVAWMSELLKLTGREKVLEIGTGSGYQTAVLAELSKEVFTVERLPELSAAARKVLKELDYKNIFFAAGDGALGWSEHAPFDRIIVTAAAESIPRPLLEQLADPGRMLIPVGPRSMQQLVLVEKSEGVVGKTALGGCVFVPLIGGPA